MIIRLSLVLSLIGHAATPASAAPSFDCKLARTPVETTICAKAELGELDAGIAESYRTALGRVRAEPDVTSALRRAHAEFLAGRDATLHWPDANLARYMASWRRWLNAVGPSRSGLEGAWINGSGTITIEHRPTGGYAVRANGDDPVRGSYTCEFIGIARRDGQSRLEVVWDTTGDEEDGGEGWTLKLQRKGGLIHLTEERNNSDAERAPFCGARGSLEGAYLPARLKPTAVRAWRPAGEASESAD